MAQAATLTLDVARLNRAVAAFVGRRAPAVADRMVRAAAFKVGDRIVRSLNGEEAGYPNPKRIDTGRYRAAWAVGTAMATGTRPAAPGASTARSGDGLGVTVGKGATRQITVTNNVEYGPYVEYGTARMAAGLHVQGALRAVAAEIEDLVAPHLKRAWREG